ncbi:MAG: tRNA 2-thiouridine(34) synthase MnmA [Bacteroidales bacterium]
MTKRVLLGMSGGTDSSVSAMLLQEAGYEVVGVTFRFYDSEDSAVHIKDAQELALRLGIEHRVFDARERFESKILSYFVEEYMSGRTPVPCVLCNNELKWRLLADIAQEESIDYISTGHYVRVEKHDDGLYYVRQGLDPDKDQSFFLWGLDQDILSKMLLPLGSMSKVEVREFAANRGFERAATKRDSLGVCFCPGDYRPFLSSRVEASLITEGNFVSSSGEVLGRHKGVPFYTVGQRRGLGLNFQKAVFVKELRPATNEVVLANLNEMYHMGMLLKDVCFNKEDNLYSEDLICRIRYRKQQRRARVELLDGGRASVRFDEAEHSIAPGQSAVFYIGDRVVGGGIIVSAQD